MEAAIFFGGQRCKMKAVLTPGYAARHRRTHAIITPQVVAHIRLSGAMNKGLGKIGIEVSIAGSVGMGHVSFRNRTVDVIPLIASLAHDEVLSTAVACQVKKMNADQFYFHWIKKEILLSGINNL